MMPPEDTKTGTGTKLLGGGRGHGTDGHPPQPHGGVHRGGGRAQYSDRMVSIPFLIDDPPHGSHLWGVESRVMRPYMVIIDYIPSYGSHLDGVDCLGVAD